ncbi:MAG: DUF6512 family protein [Patescibacteria group bacterium]|nr:DUF6512 family protein [Patescibacteria group bacterium]
MVKAKYQNIWWWILATVLLGTIWHFIYQLSGDNFIVGLVAPINESVWEHLKIVFFPLLTVGTVAYLRLKPIKSNFCTGLLVGSLTGMMIVFFGFYLYTSIIGELLIIDILLFIASIIVAMYISWWFVINTKKIMWLEILSSIGLFGITGILIYLTLKAPNLKPFIEESSGTYGIYKDKI